MRLTLDTDRSTRVLVAEDDPVIRRLVQLNFELEGFEVDLASNGEEALAKVRSSSPDVLVMDVMMPGMDGWEVCRRMREDEAIRDVPIVLVSARTLDEDRDRGAALGVRDYVTKPFDPDHLLEVVRRALPDTRRG